MRKYIFKFTCDASGKEFTAFIDAQTKHEAWATFRRLHNDYEVAWIYEVI